MGLNLREIVRALAMLHGEPERLEPKGAFEMVLFENASYLVADDVKREVFESLRAKIGTKPDEILAASSRALVKAIERGGMLPEHRASKVRRAAEIAEAAGDALSDPKRARAVLRKMPSIGEPGADKIMCFVFGERVVPLDSNGLRVLERIGIVEKDANYTRQYKAAQAALGASKDGERVYLLLRMHGKTMCTRKKEQCATCPLNAGSVARDASAPRASSREGKGAPRARSSSRSRSSGARTR
jgi:endonuclease III